MFATCAGLEEDYKNDPIDLKKLRSLDALRRSSLEPRSPATSPSAAYAASSPGEHLASIASRCSHFSLQILEWERSSGAACDDSWLPPELRESCSIQSRGRE